jgi:alpha-tubulin suppressor-like RCC1 family protein
LILLEKSCLALITYNGSYTAERSNVPVPVLGGLVFTQISVGSAHACGLLVSGAAYCWGSTNFGSGSLGNGTTLESYVPVPVLGGLIFTQISVGGYSSCGLLASGAAYCWGYNSSGTLGNGTTINSSIPVSVSGGLIFTQLAVGYIHTCGLVSNGSVYCWGEYYAQPSAGYTGDSTLGVTINSIVPLLVPSNLKFTQISAGISHSCGLTTNGAGYCWGYN